MLPNKEFHGLWESLIYDDGVKENVSQRSSYLPSVSNMNPFPVGKIRGDDYALFKPIDRLEFGQL